MKNLFNIEKLFCLLLIMVINQNMFSQITGDPNSVKINEGQNLMLKTKLGVGENKDYKYAWTGPNGFTSMESVPNIREITESQVGIYTVNITNIASTSITWVTTIAVTVLPPKVKIGFETKSITILEGEEKVIGIQVDGIIKAGKTIKVEYSLVNSDAVVDKDYTIIGGSLFEFKDSPSKKQKQFFEIKIRKDSVEEREKFTIQLKISNIDKDWMVEDTMQCTILLKDFLTSAELDRKQFKSVVDNTYKNILSIINSDKDTSEVIGKLWFKKDKIPIYEFKNSSDSTISKQKKLMGSKRGLVLNNSITNSPNKVGHLIIDSVNVAFRNGVIDEIQTFGKKSLYPVLPKVDTIISFDKFENIFLGRRIPINIVTIPYTNSFLGHRHYSKESEQNQNINLQFIYVKDYLGYRANIEKNYNPGDDEVKMNREKSHKFLKLNTALNDYIDFHIYSDLLSVLDPSIGNGLLQSDLRAKFLWNTGSFKNTNYFAIHFIEPYFHFSRFDTNLSSVSVSDSVDTKNKKLIFTSVNRQLLNQRTYLDLGLKFNILSFFFRNKSSLELNGGFGFQFAKVRLDTSISKIVSLLPFNNNTLQENPTFGVNMMKYSLGLKYSLNRYKNFGIDLCFDLWHQKMWNKKALEEQIKLKPESSDYFYFYSPKAELYYYPLKKSDNKIFVRLLTVNSVTGSESNYYQLQVGYKAQFKFKNER